MYGLARRLLPKTLRRKMHRLSRWPPVGTVRFGSLRRTEPISRSWGFDRGLPIDRHYIEEFLGRNADAVRGRVLEVADDEYTMRYGGSRVSRSDVLHVSKGSSKTTIVADLSIGDGIPKQAFDCIICTQTLQFVFDVRAAVRTVHEALIPGGTALVTLAGISQISQEDMDCWGDFWRFTTASARRAFEEAFPPENLQICAHGNVLAAIAFLHGLASEELSPQELAYDDAGYQLLVTVRADKPSTPR